MLEISTEHFENHTQGLNVYEKYIATSNDR
jgi:hypothetical protein